MASYKRQRQHGVRAQVIRGGPGASEDDPEILMMTTFPGNTAPDFLWRGEFGTTLNPTTTGLYNFCQPGCLNNILLGSTEYQRTGSIIDLVHLRARFCCDWADTLTVASGFIAEGSGRIVVVWDSQTNKVTPQAYDIFANYGYNGTINRGAQSEIRKDFQNRYKIVHDAHFALPKIYKDAAGVTFVQPTDASMWGWSSQQIDVDLTGLHTVFDNNSAASYDPTAPGFDQAQQIVTGGLFIYLVCPRYDSGIVGANQRVWRITGNISLYYKA